MSMTMGKTNLAHLVSPSLTSGWLSSRVRQDERHERAEMRAEGALMRQEAAERAADRAAETDRRAAIFGHPNAAANQDLATDLAFNTCLSKSDAKMILNAATNEVGRMAAQLAMVPHLLPVADSDPSSGGQRAIKNAWDKAFASAACICR